MRRVRGRSLCFALDSPEPGADIRQSDCSSNAIPATAPTVRHSKITIMMITGLRRRRGGGGRGDWDRLVAGGCESSGSRSVRGSPLAALGADVSLR